MSKFRNFVKFENNFSSWRRHQHQQRLSSMISFQQKNSSQNLFKSSGYLSQIINDLQTFTWCVTFRNFFVYFHLFDKTMTKSVSVLNLKLNCRSIDVVLGIRTQGRRMKWWQTQTNPLSYGDRQPWWSMLKTGQSRRLFFFFSSFQHVTI